MVGTLVGDATDWSLLLDYVVWMLVGGVTDPTKLQKKTSCIYYWQDRSRSVHSLGVTLCVPSCRGGATDLVFSRPFLRIFIPDHPTFLADLSCRVSSSGTPALLNPRNGDKILNSWPLWQGQMSNWDHTIMLHTPYSSQDIAQTRFANSRSLWQGQRLNQTFSSCPPARMPIRTPGENNVLTALKGVGGKDVS